MNNLTISFPTKTEEEKITIAKKFYRNFTDTVIETIKLLSASDKFIKAHLIGNFSIFEEIRRKGKKCQAHLGHNFNWELANAAVPLYIQQDFLAVYMPIENKIFDRIFRQLRAKTGSFLLPATEMRTAMIPWRNKQYVLALVADQSPAVPSNAYWVTFFGKPTPFVRGPENGARLSDIAVVFCHITKIKRGYYEAHLQIATENAASMEQGELTKNYVRYLEDVITANPEMWLWSHRRWKFEWKPEYGNVIE